MFLCSSTVTSRCSAIISKGRRGGNPHIGLKYATQFHPWSRLLPSTLAPKMLKAPSLSQRGLDHFGCGGRIYRPVHLAVAVALPYAAVPLRAEPVQGFSHLSTEPIKAKTPALWALGSLLLWVRCLALNLSSLLSSTTTPRIRQRGLPFGRPLCRIWVRGQDLNLRPSGYEPDELPGCSTPQGCDCAGGEAGEGGAGRV